MKDLKDKDSLSKKSGEKIEKFGEKISRPGEKVDHMNDKAKTNLHKNKK